MEISCPRCSSRFKLPAGVHAGARLRCSVCQHVFRLDMEADAADAAAPAAPSPAGAPDISPSGGGSAGMPPLEMPARKRSCLRRLCGGVLVLALLGGAGAVGWQYMRPLLAKPPMTAGEQADQISSLALTDVRQYYVDNDRSGRLLVIEGRVVNGFAAPREMIELEASIYGPDKRTLKSRRFFAGVSLSFSLLKSMGMRELETLLSNKDEILTNNMNVASGGSVPFMTVFAAPSSPVAEFAVRVVGAREGGQAAASGTALGTSAVPGGALPAGKAAAPDTSAAPAAPDQPEPRKSTPQPAAPVRP